MLAEITAGNVLAAQVGVTAARGIDLAVVMNLHHARGAESFERPHLPLEASRFVLVTDDLQYEFASSAGAHQPAFAASALGSDGLKCVEGTEDLFDFLRTHAARVRISSGKARHRVLLVTGPGTQLTLDSPSGDS